MIFAMCILLTGEKLTRGIPQKVQMALGYSMLARITLTLCRKIENIKAALFDGAALFSDHY